MRLKAACLALLSASAVFASGCTSTPMFGFPIEEGNVEAGRQAFIDHRCHQCHTVSGVRLPSLVGVSPVMLELGGETEYIKSYAELVTSIINPNHEISERYREQQARGGALPVMSPMPMPHIDTMTVRQLIDLVAFLDSRYVLVDGYVSADR